MNESIESYFEQNYTEELQNVLYKVIALLDRLNISTYEGHILNLLSESENADSLDLTITSYFEWMMINLSREFGFKVIEGATLDQMVIILRGYVDTEDYIDHQAIVRITETDMLETEKFAELVALTTELSTDTIIALLHEVDEAAIYTVQRLHLSESDPADLDQELQTLQADPVQIRNLRAYVLFIRSFHLEFEKAELIRQGYAIGLPFKVYWDVVKEEIMILDSAKQTLELLGLFLMSKEYWSNPLIAFTDLADDIYDSVNIITEVNTQFRTLHSGFQKFKAENRIS